MKRLSWIVFAGIILIAAALRFWNLGSAPDGFHADEADYGYNAYSILKTGKDEYGKPFPLIYRSFGDYKGAVYAYLTIPFVAVGLNEWAVRAPSALFGVLFIILTFAFVYRISKSYRLAFLSMVMAAMSPLGILLSRVQSDPLVGAFFFYLGFYLLLLWIEKKHWWHLFVSILSLYAGFYTYSNAQLFAVPFLVLLCVRYWGSWSKKVRLTVAALFCLLSLTMAGILVSSAGTRLGQVSIFSSMDVQLPLEERIREEGAMGVPLLVTRAFNNKVTAYVQYFIDNFASYFSYEFLFRGATQPFREQVPDSGVLLLADLPFLLIGIYTAFRKKYSWGITALIWVLMVPAVLSIARGETPNIHRFIWAAIPIYLLTATGILAAYDAISARKRKFFVALVIILFAAGAVIYLRQLFIHQPIHNPYYRNNADKELALMLKRLAPSYDVIVTQKILEHMLFFWPIEPAAYQNDGSPRDTDNARYGKFLFVTDACPSERINPAVAALTESRILYVELAQCKEQLPVVERLYFRNSMEAYRLVERIRLK